MTVQLRLTYAELGERLGLAAEAARLRARRRRWPVSRGNDGKARVSVSESELAQEPATPTVQPDDDQPDVQADDRPDDRSELIGELRTRIVDLTTDRERLQGELVAALERAARAEGEAGAVRTAIQDLAARLDRATGQIEELSRPWWRRLLGR